jgi:hypothetical protein
MMLRWRPSNSMVACATIQVLWPGNTQPRCSCVANGDNLAGFRPRTTGYFRFGESTQSHLLLRSRTLLRFSKKPRALIQLAGREHRSARARSGIRARRFFLAMLGANEVARKHKTTRSPSVFMPVSAAEAGWRKFGTRGACRGKPSRRRRLRVRRAWWIFWVLPREARSIFQIRRAKDPGVLSSWFLLLWTSKEEGTCCRSATGIVVAQRQTHSASGGKMRRPDHVDI